VLGDLVLSHGIHSYPKTVRPQIGVSRKGAKLAKANPHFVFAGNALAVDAAPVSCRALLEPLVQFLGDVLDG
jgi:hypothetical protein